MHGRRREEIDNFDCRLLFATMIHEPSLRLGAVCFWSWREVRHDICSSSADARCRELGRWTLESVRLLGRTLVAEIVRFACRRGRL
jgi:hypothetical protein